MTGFMHFLTVCDAYTCKLTKLRFFICLIRYIIEIFFSISQLPKDNIGYWFPDEGPLFKMSKFCLYLKGFKLYLFQSAFVEDHFKTH